MKRLELYSVCLSSLCLFTGCIAEFEEEPQDTGTTEAEEVGEAQQGYVIFRSDWTDVIPLPGGGPWGTDQQALYCNPGTWAIGFMQRVEAPQGSGDDTALNSVWLKCAEKNGGNPDVTSFYPGLWGTWSSLVSCPMSSFLTSARIKVESPQGSGDDSGANGVQFGCSTGAVLSAGNDGPWGTYGNWASCPQNTAICGAKIIAEEYQGDGDDTAMNGLTIICCRV